MKKFLLFCSVLILSGECVAQAAPTVVVDTLHYFFNKEYLKNATLPKDLGYFKSPAATSTAVTACGSRFENSEPLLITGLEALVADNPEGLYTDPVHIYLCYLDAEKMPIWPPVDSVVTTITTTVVTLVGGPLTKGPLLVTGDFAVLFRNMSTIAFDTVRLMRTSGRTFTSVASSNEKISDGFGYVRYAGNFSATTNFNYAGFGPTTDYEFCVAPRVQYTLSASHILPTELQQADTLCAFSEVIFRNTSSKRYTHRQYNLKEFYNKWKPFNAVPLVSGGWTSDGPIGWMFEAENAVDGRTFLGPEGGPPVGTTGPANQITFKTDSVNPDSTCFTANQFRARLWPMSMYGRIPQYVYNEDFTMCTRDCGPVSVNNIPPSGNVKIYPNPFGEFFCIKGLPPESVMTLYNSAGEKLMEGKFNPGEVVRPSSLKPGVYFLRITGNAGTEVRKIIRQ